MAKTIVPYAIFGVTVVARARARVSGRGDKIKYVKNLFLIEISMKSKLKITFSLFSVLFLMTGFGVAFASDKNEDGLYITQEVRIDSPDLNYPPLPLGTYDIVYDTEPPEAWAVKLFSGYPQHLRVRFTPWRDGQLVREVRVAWATPLQEPNVFEIHLVDADTGLTRTTDEISVIPHDWRVYDVSELNFFTDGDFYVELWAIDCEIIVVVDSSPPFHHRSEANHDFGWHYPGHFPGPCDFKIRAVVEREIALPVARARAQTSAGVLIMVLSGCD